MSRVVAAVACAAFAVPAWGFTDRYWVEPVLGTWDDASNWSLTDGGPIGGGLPQAFDNVFLFERSICIFDGTGVSAGTLFGGLNVSGSGSGVTQVFHSAGTLMANPITIGQFTERNEYALSGGVLESDVFTVGWGATGEGSLEISGTGSLSTGSMAVGAIEGTGQFDMTGGSASMNRLWLSVRASDDSAQGGPALLEQSGGTITVNDLTVGRNGTGTLNTSGGLITVNTRCAVGRSIYGPGDFNISGTADVDIDGDLVIADDQYGPGDGTVWVAGGTMDAETVTIADGVGTVGLLLVNGGAFAADTAVVGIGGDGTIEIDAGQIAITDTLIGAAPDAPGSRYTVSIDGGAYSGAGMSVGSSAGAEGRLFVSEGTLDLDLLSLGDAPGSVGRAAISGGALTATTINVGATGLGDLSHLGGTITATTITIGGANEDSSFDLSGGTLVAPTINVLPADAGGGRSLNLSGGDVTGGTLHVMAGADAAISDGVGSLDARIPTVINDGSFTFDGASNILSGFFLFNNRLLGSFTNNGDLRFDSLFGSTADAFVMNLDNHGTLGVEFMDRAIVTGRITNHAAGLIRVSRLSGGGSGYLEARSASGIVNDGTLELDNGTVNVPNGALTNNATMTGFGEITAPLINNGSYAPDPAAIVNDLVCAQGYACGPASSTRFVITNAGHNRVVVTLGDATVGGTINVAFASDVPLPPKGTEYELIVAEDGNVDDVFSGEAILGFPCEIVYEPTRVLARSLRCGPADVAAPFGSLNLDDIDAFVAAFLALDPIADCDGSGALNLDDIDCFVADFLAGCP